jgi:hypothetical protein
MREIKEEVAMSEDDIVEEIDALDKAPGCCFGECRKSAARARICSLAHL